MVKRHLSRLAAPKAWPVKRKGIKFIARPAPGAHNLESSMSIRTILVEVLKIASNAKEAKHILNHGYVEINGVVRKDPKMPVGVMDVLSLKKIDKNYRMLYKKTGKLALVEIDKKEAKVKPAKIIKKSLVKGGKVQLNFYDGTNILLEKDDYRTGDTLVLELPSLKIKEHLPFEKGALIYFIGGKQIANSGKLEEVKEGKDMQEDNIIFSKDKEKFETARRHAFVIGKKDAVIKLENE